MASKSKRRRRVLGASCILAALIVGASSFAWFTSKEEVTNRLTATADYGVSLVEDFTPPKDMTPGQVVNKDVATVNTGSVDAFVRVKLTNAVDFTRLTSQDLDTDWEAGSTYFSDPSTGAIQTPSSMTDTDHSGAVPSGFDYLYDLRQFGDKAEPSAATGTTLVTLNPVEKVNSDGTTTANEVTTLMAGGKVVVAASTAVAPDKQEIRSGDDINGGGATPGYSVIYTNSAGDAHMVRVSADEYHVLDVDQNGYYVDNSTVANAAQKTGLKVEALAHDYSGTNQYKPAGNGLYLFKRTTSTGATEHSGFYYYDGTFYALKTKTENSGSTTTPYVDGTITYESSPKNTDVVYSVADIDLLSTQHYTTPSNGAFTMALTATKGSTALTADYGTATYMTVTHHVTADGDTTKDIIFYVKLANNWKDYWTYVPATVENGAGYFYYNTKLESGQTSKNLIDSVELADTMTSQHYLDMTYDLKVALDSVQVTKDEHGNETMAAVVTTGTDAWATPTPDYNGAATGTTAGGDGIIDSISWA